MSSGGRWPESAVEEVEEPAGPGHVSTVGLGPAAQRPVRRHQGHRAVGGGDDGAFGSGLLVGWSAHGGRPQFKLVTGVSTGALIAPTL